MKWNRRVALEYLCSVLVMVCMSCITMSCTTIGGVPAASQMPSGAKFQGVWFSEQFQHMYLRQVGDSVRGIYTYKYGGTLEGKISGNLLLFNWLDPGDKDAAVRTQHGQGYLQIVETEGGGYALKGRWGYNDDRRDGGIWNAEFVREVDGDDPRNLKEWRELEVR